MTESIDQLTFAGLDRPAMILGAPLKPIGVVFLSLAKFPWTNDITNNWMIVLR